MRAIAGVLVLFALASCGVGETAVPQPGDEIAVTLLGTTLGTGDSKLVVRGGPCGFPAESGDELDGTGTVRVVNRDDGTLYATGGIPLGLRVYDEESSVEQSHSFECEFSLDLRVVASPRGSTRLELRWPKAKIYVSVPMAGSELRDGAVIPHLFLDDYNPGKFDDAE